MKNIKLKYRCLPWGKNNGAVLALLNILKARLIIFLEKDVW